MVDQLPNRGLELEMLNEMGFSSIDDLFSDLPERVRMQEALPLPPPQSEEEIIADARRLLGANLAMGDVVSFLGAGIYRNYVPSSVFQLAKYFRGNAFSGIIAPAESLSPIPLFANSLSFILKSAELSLFSEISAEGLSDNQNPAPIKNNTKGGISGSSFTKILPKELQ